MQTEEIKTRFGRCPYCRAMIYQNPKAVVYYCSRCRTPIRGKNPEPTYDSDDPDYALSRLDILSVDTASVFSDKLDGSKPPSVIGDDGDQPPLFSSSASYSNSGLRSEEAGAPYSSYRGVRSSRGDPRSSTQNRASRLGDRFDGFHSGTNVNHNEQDEADMYDRRSSSLNKRVNELRPSSRRTRRSSSADASNLRDDAPSTNSDDGHYTPGHAYEPRRRSPLSSQELEPSMDMSGPEEPAEVTRSAMTDPAFRKEELLQALENLRRFVIAVEQPRGLDDYRGAGTRQPQLTSASYGPGGNAKALTRRDSRLFRQLESQLVQALPTGGPNRNASAGSSSSSSASSGSGERFTARKHHCRPMQGGAPFVVCINCSELLQTPVVLPRRKATRLQCGACEKLLVLTLPTIDSSGDAEERPSRAFSAPQYDGHRTDEQSRALARSGLSGEQQRRPEMPLHRVMGYNSVSSVMQSRRY